MITLTPIQSIKRWTNEQRDYFKARLLKFIYRQNFSKLPIAQKQNKIRNIVLDHIGASFDTLPEWLSRMAVYRPEIYERMIARALEPEVNSTQNAHRQFAPIIINQINTALNTNTEVAGQVLDSLSTENFTPEVGPNIKYPALLNNNP